VLRVDNGANEKAVEVEEQNRKVIWTAKIIIFIIETLRPLLDCNEVIFDESATSQ